MKVLVCGGRNYLGRERVYEILNMIRPSSVVHGACPSGADHYASEWTSSQKVPLVTHPAEWSRLGRAAGPIRNKEMLDKNDDIGMVIAFPGGAGTENMIGLAFGRGIPVLIVP